MAQQRTLTDRELTDLWAKANAALSAGDEAARTVRDTAARCLEARLAANGSLAA